MEPTRDHYPVFAANQILTNAHLNQAVDYLDEQQRLTRANLIGIGIVCGLEVTLEGTPAAPLIHVSRGCGVTSQGYLISLAQSAELSAYRSYNLPDDLAYPSFKNNNTQYPLWELFAAGEPETQTLASAPAGFLDDKALLLFLELKKESLRNCSPNNCDDKGAEMNITLRLLLIRISDLDQIIIKAQALDDALGGDDLAALYLARLQLPDLRLPRYAVPQQSLATSEQVLNGFLQVFQQHQLVDQLSKALIACYEAFQALVIGDYPNNPFLGFQAQFDFLQNQPTTIPQVRFLPYYYDFFGDLIKAYDELRELGIELLCACCPDDDLFPRHLMAGVLYPENVSEPSLYRHHFLASPAFNRCERQHKDFRQLFSRLVSMIASFTHQPPLANSPISNTHDPQIRITPTRSGSIALSQQAIPYYYRQNLDPALYQVWNPQYTRYQRAQHNLSYRADEYLPAAPDFVLQPLHYTLEAYNFLRIEGHLGKPYQNVLAHLLNLKQSQRLPFEVIALRSGIFDESIALNEKAADCHFQDLEAIYDTLRESLLCGLCEGARYFYDRALVPATAAIANPPKLAGGKPKLNLFKQYAPLYFYPEDSVGAWYEKYLALIQGKPYIDIDQNQVDNNELVKVYCFLFTGTQGLHPKNYAHVVSIYYLSKLAEVLPQQLDALAFEDFANKYQDLQGLVRFFRAQQVEQFADELQEFIPQEDLVDRFDEILAHCQLEAITALYQEYQRRVRELQKKQFLGYFLKQHPGIQHQAGVPLGGTFILVYHEPAPNPPPDPPVNALPRPGGISAGASAGARTANQRISARNARAKNFADVSDTFDAIKAQPESLSIVQIQALIAALNGLQQGANIANPAEQQEPAAAIIEQALAALIPGAVIADFFLPYLCCSDCAAVQFVLPTPPFAVEVEIGCSGPQGAAAVQIYPQGGIPPYTYQLDGQDSQELLIPLYIAVGEHSLVVYDSSGGYSLPQNLTVPPPLSFGTENYSEDIDAQIYQFSFTISGGVPPYSGNGEINGDEFLSPKLSSGEEFIASVSDSRGCELSQGYTHAVPLPCQLPCAGITRRCEYRMWLPAADLRTRFNRYESYAADVLRFEFTTPDGQSVDLKSDVNDIIQAIPDDLNHSFDQIVNDWIVKINDLITNLVDDDNWLKLSYSRKQEELFGSLKIEYFVCLAFHFELVSQYRYPRNEEIYQYNYSHDSTKIFDVATQSSVLIPPANCVEIDKCHPELPEKALCKPLKLKIKIKKTALLAENGESAVLKLEAQVSGSQEPPAVYFWEVQDAKPSLANGKSAEFTIRRDETDKLIRLTVYTSAGCSQSVVDTYNFFTLTAA